VTRRSADGRDVNKVQPPQGMPMAMGAISTFGRVEGNSVPQSRKKPSTNITCTHWSTPRLFMTVKQSKWNLSARRGSSRRRSMFTTDLKLTRTTGLDL